MLTNTILKSELNWNVSNDNLDHLFLVWSNVHRAYLLESTSRMTKLITTKWSVVKFFAKSNTFFTLQNLISLLAVTSFSVVMRNLVSNFDFQFH